MTGSSSSEGSELIIIGSEVPGPVKREQAEAGGGAAKVATFTSDFKLEPRHLRPDLDGELPINGRITQHRWAFSLQRDSWKGTRRHDPSRDWPVEVSSPELRDYLGWMGLDHRDGASLMSQGNSHLLQRILDEIVWKRTCRQNLWCGRCSQPGAHVAMYHDVTERRVSCGGCGLSYTP